MTVVLDDTAGLVAGAAEELGGSREPQGPYSPLKTVERAKRPAVQDKGQLGAKKPKTLATKRPTAAKTGGGGSRREEEKEPSESTMILNSQEFPDPETRPAMFRDDRLFNRLTFEHAARVMWEYAQSEEKKREQ